MTTFRGRSLLQLVSFLYSHRVNYVECSKCVTRLLRKIAPGHPWNAKVTYSGQLKYETLDDCLVGCMRSTRCTIQTHIILV